MKDWLGEPIVEGMMIVYATSQGSSPVEFRLGRVKELVSDSTLLVEWIKTTRYSLPDKPTKVTVTKVIAMPHL